VLFDTAMSIEKRISELEKQFAPEPPVRLLMGDGRIVEIHARAGENVLEFITRLGDSPLSSDAENICAAVQILQQPGCMVELLTGMLTHKRDVLVGRIIEPAVEAGLCEVWESCGLKSPPTETELAKLRTAEMGRA
jgi:hypothetical protein